MKRVYTAVATAAVAGGHEVRLDGRSLRSPAKASLIFPTAGLADAVAAEWEAQKETVQPHTMPLMQIASTAVDRIAAQQAAVAAAVVAYAETDLLCYRAEHPQELAQRQNRHWQPLLDWAALQHDAALRVLPGLMPRPQPPEAVQALRRVVERCDVFGLSALQLATAASGSLVIALALLAGRVTPDQAFVAACLDELFQAEQWGEDAEAVRRRESVRGDLVAARRFHDLLSPRP